MKIFLKKIYLVFWSLIPLILLFSYKDPDSTIDINIHDTYLIIGLFQLGILTSIFLGIIGFTYWILDKLNRKRISWLTFVHTLFTIGGILIITLANSIFREAEFESSNRSPYFDSLLITNVIVALSFICILMSQLFLIVNCLIGIFRKEN